MSSGGLELLTFKLETMSDKKTKLKEPTNPPLLIADVSGMLSKEITAKEVFNYFYYLGAADGIVKSLSGDKPDFDRRFDEFIAEVRKGNFR